MSKISNTILYTLLATGLTNCAHNGVTSHVNDNNQNEIVPPCNEEPTHHQASSSQTETLGVWTKKRVDYMVEKLSACKK